MKVADPPQRTSRIGCIRTSCYSEREPCLRHKDEAMALDCTLCHRKVAPLRFLNVEVGFLFNSVLSHRL